MKKILLKTLISSLLFINLNVYAASYNLNLEADNYEVEKNSTVEAYISLNNINDINDGLNVCETVITSSPNIQINSVTGINSWNALKGKILILDSAEYVKSYTKIAQISLTINGEGTLTLSSSFCTDGNELFETNNSNISFKIKEPIVVEEKVSESSIIDEKELDVTNLNNNLITSETANNETKELNNQIFVNENVDNESIEYESVDASKALEKVTLKDIENKEETVLKNNDNIDDTNIEQKIDTSENDLSDYQKYPENTVGVNSIKKEYIYNRNVFTYSIFDRKYLCDLRKKLIIC